MCYPVRKCSKLVLSGLVLLGIIGLNSLPGVAFKVSIHENITSEALAFLKPDILDDINDEHLYQDVRQFLALLDPERHFDSCRFQEATTYIRSQYDEVLKFLDPKSFRPTDATDEFGQLLHTVQDFYSHSNWVEIRKGAGQPNDLLVEADLEPWPVLQPWKIYKGVMIVQGETPPIGWVLSRTGRIVSVVTPNGTAAGLITGTFGPDDCPDSIALSHGDLNKDSKGRPGHDDAYKFAVAQTTHEWFRLKELVKRKYGAPVVNSLCKEWVKDKAVAECP